MKKKEDLSKDKNNLTNSIDNAYNSLQRQREQKAHENPDVIDIFDNYSNGDEDQNQQSLGNNDWMDRSEYTDKDSDQSGDGEEGEEAEGEEAEDEEATEGEGAEGAEGSAEGEEAEDEEATEGEGAEGAEGSAEGEEAEGAATKQAGSTAARTEVADAAAEGTAEALEGGAVDAAAEGAAEVLGPEAAAALAAADYVAKKTTGKSIPQLLLYTILGLVLSVLGLVLAVAFGLGLMNTNSAIADPIATGEQFPVPDFESCIPNINNPDCPSGGRYFKAPRPGRYHAGIDLLKNFSNSGEVVAVKDGTVTILMADWFQSTDALIINHGDYSINYGEIEVDPSVRSAGTKVKAGQKLGKMQINDNGNAMLHFELYEPGVTRSYQWYVGNSQPDELRDPTKFLEDLLKAKNAGT